MAGHRAGVAARSAKRRSRRSARASSGPTPGAVSTGHPDSSTTPTTAGVEHEALSISHWFDSGRDGKPYSATVRLTGRRVGARGKPKGADRFVKEVTIDGIVPGSGPVSITTRVDGLAPGEWTVSADVMRLPGGDGRYRPGHNWSRVGSPPVHRAAWSWRRWALSIAPATPVHTRWTSLVRLARLPAVIHGSWVAFVVGGVIVGLALQGAILAQEGISIGQSLAVSLLAVVSGLIGAKLWYMAQHPRSWRTSAGEGLSVNGFLVGTPLVGVAALLSFDLPIGVFLDATSPALFFGVAIGRLGCFFTGCCAGRCTTSRWGVWSSDRRVGARRIPTQLLESLGGLVIGIATLILVLLHASPIGGGIFVAGMATYVVLRHILLQLRAEPHRPTFRTRLTVAVAALVFLADATVLLLWPVT